MTHAQKYRSLQLAKAVASSWTRHHKLNAAEISVLLHISIWGVRDERGMAFAWFPLEGMDSWGEKLDLPRNTLFRTTRSLVEKGLLVPVVGGSKNTRFRGKKGYAIPNRVMDEVNSWSTRSGTQEVPEVVPESTRSGTQTPHLTCDDAVHTHIQPREENPLELKLQPSTSGDSGEEQDNDMPFTYEDEWSAGSDERDDFDRPRDLPPARTKRPSSRIADHFEAGWLEARQESPMLALPWKNKAGFLKNLNTMLTQFSEEQIRAMIDVFFRLAVANEVYLGSPELWRDFLSARARCWQIVMQQELVEVDRPITQGSGDWMIEAKRQREVLEARRSSRDS